MMILLNILNQKKIEYNSNYKSINYNICNFLFFCLDENKSKKYLCEKIKLVEGKSHFEIIKETIELIKKILKILMKFIKNILCLIIINKFNQN